VALLLQATVYNNAIKKEYLVMPQLTKEQLDQVKYVSIQDYCQQVDRLDSLEDKLVFSTRYILTYNQINNGEADPNLEKLIKVAHMKISDKSADLKEFYHETDVNRGRAEVMVDPTVDVYDNDIENQMFITDPVGYLKGKAQELQGEVRAKQWKTDSDIQIMISTANLINEGFTNQLGNKIANDIKKPTVFDVNVRLENAFGGPAGLKKAYDNTKPGILSKMFSTSSLAYKNLDTAYKAFNNPKHAFHGDLDTVQKAATEYLQHVLPNYKPDRLKNIPTLQDINRLSGTRKARALLSINLLNAVKAQKTMECDYNDMLAECQGKNLSFAKNPSNQEVPNLVENQQSNEIDQERSNSFQAELQKDLIEGEVSKKSNYLVEDSNVENQVKADEVELDK
jgi:hypothetical protein